MNHQYAIRQFGADEYKELEHQNQHNIMMVVGNGFDIAALSELRARLMTDYQSFYKYMTENDLARRDNVLIAKMGELKRLHETAPLNDDRYRNWSDFEAILEKHFAGKNGINVDLERINQDLTYIQHQFSKFLDKAVEPDVLNALDSLAEQHSWGYRTFGRFTADVGEEDFKRFRFPNRVGHKHLFNYNVINFNYTSLLDNYLYMDKQQFQPRLYKTSDANFSFSRNLRNFENAPVPHNYPDSNTGCSAYFMYDVHHPHGQQQIPRSLLFGISGEDDSRNSDPRYGLEKEYWSQADRRYEKMIHESELFIIFGSSIGQSDRWWWKHILWTLCENDAELIIYTWTREPVFGEERFRLIQNVKSNFIRENYDSALFAEPWTPQIEDKLSAKIFVVAYSDPTTISAFGFSKGPFEADHRHYNYLNPPYRLPLPQ
ncbi:bacteriophage abortive infection AbiH family protein [Corynebacterium cystitidis]|uniref:bacteriophage abortive infection AbiH family protein n=1 Tax=Corynebacterium cystitidis TaxID=35757 RepID=UPI00211EBC70|nr:bacteriophage abortive infection AbiH family protein [Corynebacterium cystitidis]